MNLIKRILNEIKSIMTLDKYLTLESHKENIERTHMGRGRGVVKFFESHKEN